MMDPVDYLKLLRHMSNPALRLHIEREKPWVRFFFYGPAGSVWADFRVKRENVGRVARRLINDGVEVPREIADLALRQWEAER